MTFGSGDCATVKVILRQGAMMHSGAFDLGVVAPSTPVEFTLFYGISADTDDARAALAGVGADVFSLQESSALSDETVGVFAYRADPAQAP